MGRMPYAAPAADAASAALSGMCRTPIAMSSAVASPTSAATCALTLPVAMHPRSTAMGSAATSVDAKAFPSGL